MNKEELLINDIMETLYKLHAFDSYEESEVDSVKTCISHTVINHDRNDLQAILETLQDQDISVLSGVDKAVYYGVIARLNAMIRTPSQEKLKINDAISALSWIRNTISNRNYIGELNDYAWYTALLSIDTAIEMLEENPEESFD